MAIVHVREITLLDAPVRPARLRDLRCRYEVTLGTYHEAMCLNTSIRDSSAHVEKTACRHLRDWRRSRKTRVSNSQWAHYFEGMVRNVSICDDLVADGTKLLELATDLAVPLGPYTEALDLALYMKSMIMPRGAAAWIDCSRLFHLEVTAAPVGSTGIEVSHSLALKLRLSCSIDMDDDCTCALHTTCCRIA